MAEERTLELVKRRLLGDSERTQAPLVRSRVDEIYLKYGIAPDQAAVVERELLSAGVLIDEEDESDQEHEEGATATPSTTSPTFADALSHLMHQAKKLPLLSRQDEQRLGEAIQRGLAVTQTSEMPLDGHTARLVAKAKEARERLISSNIRLVVKLVMRPNFRYRMDVDDLVQYGMIGLMRAAEKFDPDVGTRFSTYATWWIRQAVTRGIHNDGNVIRLPVHVIASIHRFRRTQRQLGLTQGRREHVKLIAESLGWTDDYTARISLLSEMNVVSLDAPLGSDDGNGSTLGDLMADTADRPDEAVELLDIRAAVRSLVDDIQDERARDIVKRRFGFDGPDETLQEIGDRYEVTRERIRQVEAKTLDKLEKRAIAKGLRGNSF
ncbi:RNA polymerase sigma factor RpoD/SigA [Sphingomonas koreensis]|jgi:RNA polymerase primary sigma factor|nr:RNA polymerase primary sigma factor [Sphingomonas koreensis]RSU59782.1 RNA polymerase sigma factor RpoD/SigA [Sphingomonas koreensis]RSU70824.1 RNA polymerase sigma factor RpoD/SigA [Sphingomonas koreensis]RSV13308.1 RNA polymerase sigma factor RpoD/SigA [Sphingomonas sp. ABOLF]